MTGSVIRRGSSCRTARPSQTLASARRLFTRVGITRLTDTTRMDRLGLPVYACIRPTSRTLRVHAGKGLVAVDAAVGAAMEAVEHWAAEPENSRWRRRWLTVEAIEAQLGGELRFADFIPGLDATIGASEVLPTVRCEELRSTARVWLPAELIFFPPPVEDRAVLFRGHSTNGLASGNDVCEATLHALFEILERDAKAMAEAVDDSSWISPEDFPRQLARLAERWRNTGVELAVRHLPSAVGLPCFEAVLHEPNSSDVNLAAGWGLHVNRTIALTRAVCEAAQSRLSHIHGGRDDITSFYRKYSGSADERKTLDAALVSKLFDRRRTVRLGSLPSSRLPAKLADVLEEVLVRMAAAGFGRVFRYRFAVDLEHLSVVRVVVPGCEHVGSIRQRIGPRLMARITQDA